VQTRPGSAEAGREQASKFRRRRHRARGLRERTMWPEIRRRAVGPGLIKRALIKRSGPTSTSRRAAPRRRARRYIALRALTSPTKRRVGHIAQGPLPSLMHQLIAPRIRHVASTLRRFRLGRAPRARCLAGIWAGQGPKFRSATFSGWSDRGGDEGTFAVEARVQRDEVGSSWRYSAPAVGPTDRCRHRRRCGTPRPELRIAVAWSRYEGRHVPRNGST